MAEASTGSPSGGGPAKKTQIVVVGGGAGGLQLVRRLGARYGRRAHDIILLDHNRTHVWKPLLHEVAAGSLDANLDEVGYRGHCWRWGYRFFYGGLEGVDREARRVFVAPLRDEDGTELVGRHAIRYDYLVLAVGSVTNDYGVPGVREHCILLDDRAQADRFRSRLLDHCLRVSRAMMQRGDADEHVRIVIVGGGATGVELAAELYNAAKGLAHYGLEVFDETRLQVTLVEAGERILPLLPEDVAQAARDQLEALGVRILTRRPVVEATPDAILTAQGERIEADLKVWVAGVRGPDVLRDIGGLETNRAQQIVVLPTLQTPADPRVFAIGDCASCMDPASGKPIPPRAQAAHQMAGTAAANLGRLMAGRPLKAFRYHDHGSLVSLSRFSAVGSLMGGLKGGRMAVYGLVARLVYRSLYCLHLLAIHGWLRGFMLILVGQANAVVRPRVKFH